MKAKKVITKDANGIENGWLMELYKDGDKTLMYLTAAKPGAFKGYHLHRQREANYICIKGKFKVTLFTWSGNNWNLPAWNKEEHILEAGDKLHIPTDTPTGLENIGKEEAWLINYPSPAYDPKLIGEQVEYTLEELEKGVKK